MSFISTRSRYGLRLLCDLASHPDEGPVDLASIAKRQDIPAKYLAKLVMPLLGAGFVRSVRGSHGGYELAVKPEMITLLSLVEILEGSASLLICIDAPEHCQRALSCPTRPIWSGLEQRIHDYLRSVTLADTLNNTGAEYSI